MTDKDRLRLEKELINYKGEDEIVSSIELLDSLNEKRKDIPTVSMVSGIPSFDRHIQSFDGGELTIISGETAQGKTLFSQTLTDAFVKQNKYVLWFSFEVQALQFLNQFSQPVPAFLMPNSITASSIDWIRKRAIEAKLKFGLDAMFIDHLHFLIDMGSGRNNISLEIGSIMRALKKMALSLDIAIFILVHTNRDTSRTEPDISSIRDCLPYNQKIYMLDGSQKQICDVKKGDNVLSFRSQRLLQEDTVTDCCESGIKKIFKITTDTGRTIEASDGHKFFAMTFGRTNKIGENKSGTGVQGWTKLIDLKIGQKILVVREYPENNNAGTLTEYQAITLGWIVGDGHISKYGYAEITVNTQEECETLKRIADNGWGLDCKYSKYKDKSAFRFYTSCGNNNNELARFFRRNNYYPVGKDKHVLPEIMTQPNNIIAAYLKGLFHADGSVSSSESSKMCAISMSTISYRLAMDVKHLLLKLGIRSCLMKNKHGKSGGYKTNNYFIYLIAIYGEDIITFMDKIGFFDAKQEKAMRMLSIHKSRKIKRKKKDGHLYYERIKKIEYIGELPTFDIGVRGHHASIKNNSFCVEGFVTHNSNLAACEADNVFFVWRLMNTENQAMVKIAKNRKFGVMNKKVKLQKQGKYLVEVYDI